jgi:hypothetical protein
MTANIESITLWENNPDKTRTSSVVRINFKFPCTWTTLTIEELKQILRLWIETEENRYKTSEGFRGRALLFEEIVKVFEEKI